MAIGLILRLVFLDKSDGLWNDEYISWQIAQMPLFKGFIDGIKSQCHMPFYYIYLKLFMTLFGQNDIVLRLSSVTSGVLSIFVMYLVGKEKDEKTGLLCAGFCAISSFLIYYSQEVRLYSLLFLLSAMTLLYTLRIIKQPDKKNLILWGISAFLVMFTHTIGFVFIFFNILFLSVVLYKSCQKAVLRIWMTVCGISVLCLPLILKIFMTHSFSQWWGNFSVAKIGFLITDYFSPILTNLTNSPQDFFYNFSPEFIIFALIPAFISLVFLVNALKNKINAGLFLSVTGILIVLILAALSGKLVFLTKYSMEIYPILIYLICCGISDMKSKKIKTILVYSYCILTAVYLIFYPYSAPKIRRPEGHKIAADLLYNAKLSKGDIILLEYYPSERFEKYFDFSDYKVISVNKANFNEYLRNDNSMQEILQNGKEIYKPMFLDGMNLVLKNRLNKEILKDLKPGQSVVMLVLDSVAFYPPDTVKEITNNEKRYEKEPFLFLVFSYIKSQIFDVLSQNMSVTNYEKKGNWMIMKFTKLNN